MILERTPHEYNVEAGRVLLVADAHWYLIWHLPRLFKQAGADLTLMSPPGQPFRRSRFVDRWIELAVESQAAVATIEEHLSENTYDLVAFTPQHLFETLMKRASGARWLDWLRPEMGAALQSKIAFHEWAASRNLKRPPGRVCRGVREVERWVEEHGPSIMKRDHVHGGFGVRRVNTPKEAATRWGELGLSDAVLVEKFIEGAVGVTELILNRGDVLAWFASTKERTSQPFGASVMRRPVCPGGMKDLVDSVARAIGFHGLCGFDWVEDACSGEVYLLEFHSRVSSGFGVGCHAGVDVPGALRDLIAGRSGPVREPLTSGELAEAPSCCYFPGHLWYALRRDPSDLRHWMPGAKAVSWRNAPLDDLHVLWPLAKNAARRFSDKIQP